MPRIYVTDGELADARTILANHGVTDKHILVGVNPAAAFGPAKCWLPDKFRHVTQKLLENPPEGKRVLLPRDFLVALSES